MDEEKSLNELDCPWCGRAPADKSYRNLPWCGSDKCRQEIKNYVRSISNETEIVNREAN